MLRPISFLPLLAIALLAGCQSSQGKPALPSQGTDLAVGVRVVKPADKMDGALTRVTGKLVPRNEASIAAKATGTIAAFLVDVGDTVEKGQEMARLDTSNAILAVEQAKAAEAVAKAAYENASLELERAKKLHASGGVAQAGLDRAKAGYAQAKAGLAQATAGRKAAQQALTDHTVRAPFDGVVTGRMMNVGEFVAMNPIFTLVDVNDLEVVLPVPESVIGAVRQGARLHGVLSPQGKPFSATVRVVGKVVDPDGRTVEVRGDLTGERSDQMRPHAIVEVDFSQEEGIEGLFLPRQAVRGEGEERYVWVVEDGKLVRRDVEVELLAPGTFRILSGIEGSEAVVSDAGGSYHEGMKVRTLQ